MVLRAPLACLLLSLSLAAAPGAPSDPDRALGTVLLGPIDVAGPTRDTSCSAVEVAWGRFWVYGYRSLDIHEFDLSGNFVATHSGAIPPTLQSYAGGMEADESANKLYVAIGGDNFLEWDYDPILGSLRYNRTFLVPGVGNAKALCRNPATGSYFAKDFVGDIYEFDIQSGVISNVITSSRVSACGFGWDDQVPSIWVASAPTTAGTSVLVEEIDPTTGMTSGNSFVPLSDPWNIGLTAKPGGADVFDTGGTAAFAMIHLNNPTALVVYELKPSIRPILTLANFVAGQFATMTVDNASPSGVVFFAYSLTGGGPVSFPAGTVLLSPPIQLLPPIPANAFGQAVFPVPLPPGISGIPVWIQALDATSMQFSNGDVVVIG